MPFASGSASRFVLAAIDRRAGEPSDPRDNREPAPAGSPHLGCCEQAPPPFVEPDADRVPAILNGALIIHATDIRLFAPIRNPGRPSHTTARTRVAIQLLFGMSLARPVACRAPCDRGGSPSSYPFCVAFLQTICRGGDRSVAIGRHEISTRASAAAAGRDNAEGGRGVTIERLEVDIAGPATDLKRIVLRRRARYRAQC